MKVQHIRNATLLLSVGELRLLVDPMFGEVGAYPGFKMSGAQRNPLVPLPEGAMEVMEQATDVLITHEHPDHLDPPALAWIKEKGLPVWAGSIDVPNLRKKGLDAREFVDGSLGLSVELVPAKHGRGLLGWLMGPVSGFYIAHPDEPSVYMTADSILTGTVLEAVERLQPELVIAPAGAANMGLGNLLFSVDELVELTRRVPGKVMFNHLESLDHCPTTRAGLQERMAVEGLAEKVLIPTDGELLSLSRGSKAPHVAPKAKASRKPGLQKWVSATFAGT